MCYWIFLITHFVFNDVFAIFAETFKIYNNGKEKD